MSQLDDLIAQSLASQKAQVEAQLQAEKAKITDELLTQKTDAENDINAQQRSLDNQFAGFVTGIIAPAYAGTQAGVLERDPLRGQGSPHIQYDAAEKPSKTAILPILAIAAATYYYFFRKRR